MSNQFFGRICLICSDLIFFYNVLENTTRIDNGQWLLILVVSFFISRQGFSNFKHIGNIISLDVAVLYSYCIVSNRLK